MIVDKFESKDSKTTNFLLSVTGEKILLNRLKSSVNSGDIVTIQGIKSKSTDANLKTATNTINVTSIEILEPSTLGLLGEAKLNSEKSLQELTEAKVRYRKTAVILVNFQSNHVLTTSEVRSIYYGDNSLPGNQSPTIQLSSPTSNATITNEMTIPFTVTTNDPDGVISTVEYIANNIAVGESLNTPYNFGE